MQSIEDLLFYMIIFLPVYIIARLIFVKIKRRRSNLAREAVLAVFSIYCFGLAVMLFRPAYGIDLVDIMRNNAERGAVNLTPFKTIHMYITYADHFNLKTVVENLLGNVLVFSPIGLGLPMLWTRWQRLWRVLLFGLLAPTLVETIQYFTARCADVDDLILNCLGTVVGYLLYRLIVLLARLLPKLSA
jgi:glycopeptide antibiotics resistance protein